MKKILIVVLLLPLVACNGGTEQTKEWYLQHPKEREARAAECRNDAKLQASADCQNALAAAAQAFVFGSDGKIDAPHPSPVAAPQPKNGDDYSIDVTPKRGDSKQDLPKQ